MLNMCTQVSAPQIAEDCDHPDCFADRDTSASSDCGSSAASRRAQRAGYRMSAIGRHRARCPGLVEGPRCVHVLVDALPQEDLVGAERLRIWSSTKTCASSECSRLEIALLAVAPISGLTAIHALRDAGRLQTGQDVLIVCASGGVGSYAVQLAKAFGANVTGVCSTAKIDLVRTLGADRVIDYTQDDFADGTHLYELVLDIGGSTPLSRLRRATTPKGTLVIVGGEEGGKLTGMGRQVRALMLSPFVSQRLTILVPKENFADLERLAEFIEVGAVTPTVDREYPLEQAADAMRQLVAGKVHGKLAITI